MSIGRMRRSVPDWEIKSVKSEWEDVVVVAANVAAVVSVRLKNRTLKRD
jgi:hypothetical protein